MPPEPNTQVGSPYIRTAIAILHLHLYGAFNAASPCRFVMLAADFPPGSSSSMQRRYKDDIVTCLNFVFVFSFQLPISIVDEDEYAWPSGGRQQV